MSRSKLIAKSGVSRVYAYEVFRGKKRPSRNIFIRILVALALNYDEINNVLIKLEYPVLYAKNIRDALIIYGIKNHMDVDNISILLYESGQEIL